jgi:hypothetical protein
MKQLKNNLIFRPSSAHRWFHCPGSVAIESSVPDSESSVFALEGTAAHELCRYFAMLSASESDISQHIGKPLKSILPVIDVDIDLESSIRNIIIDPKMAAGVWKYCKYVYDLLNGESPLNRDIVQFEQYVKTDFGVGGTADCIVIDWPAELHIIDFKYGKRVSVDPFENLQLLIYAIGALNIEDDIEKVTLHIIQPRDKYGNHIKTWTLSKDELETKWIPKLKKAVSNCHNKQTTFKLGDWCRWCKGASAGICPKVTRTAQKLTKTKKDTKVPADIKKLSKLLQSEKAVLEYFNRAKMEAFNRLQRGESIPGYKLVQSFGNTTWKDADEVESDAISYGFSRYLYNTKLKTPNQLKKRLKENDFDTDWIDEMTHKPSKGLVLVPDTDKRPEYKTAKQDFEDE